MKMGIGFDNICEHMIPMSDFALRWRFTDRTYDELPPMHLEQLKPLDEQASKFLSDFIEISGLHDDVPFKRNFFGIEDKIEIAKRDNKEIKKWLYERGLPFEKEVYLSWGPSTAMIVPWKLVIKYFSAFYYSSSDDLTVIDDSLNWALLFFHTDEICFGTNEIFLPSKLYHDIDLIW